MNVNVIEIRNYLLKPDVREHFIDYFEEHFIVSQQNLKMDVLGQFRLIGEPDHFVWVRGFSDMATRLEGLQNFYGGPVWKKYGAVANAMMIDSDNVHLLRPISGTDLTNGLSADTVAADLAAGTISPNTGLVAIDFYHAIPGKRDALIDQFQTQVAPAYQNAGIQIRGGFVAEMSTNEFPRLPALQDQNEFIVITAYASEAAYREKREQVVHAVDDAMGGLQSRTRESLLLSPTLRSPLRHVPE